MESLSIFLSILVVTSAGLCLYGKYFNNPLFIYLFKPLTTILIFFIALQSGSSTSANYAYLIYIGLIFCLFGDVFLIIPNKFTLGLLSFLVAHLFFAVFFITLSKSISYSLIIIFTILGTIIYSILYKYLGKMKIPVLIYVTIIFLMAWRGFEYYLTAKNTASILIAISVILFMFSDSNIAFNKFKKTYKSAEFLILTTYYLSIYLISISLLFI